MLDKLIGKNVKVICKDNIHYTGKLKGIDESINMYIKEPIRTINGNSGTILKHVIVRGNTIKYFGELS